MKCPICGNRLFDQGLSTVYCGACETIHKRPDTRQGVRDLLRTGIDASGRSVEDTQEKK